MKDGCAASGGFGMGAVAVGLRASRVLICGQMAQKQGVMRSTPQSLSPGLLLGSWACGGTLGR